MVIHNLTNTFDINDYYSLFLFQLYNHLLFIINIVILFINLKNKSFLFIVINIVIF